MKKFRFQPLRSTYKELCALLYHTALHVQTNDFTTDAAALLKKVKNTLSVFEYQTATEEAVLFSAIHDYEPALMAILRDDHRERMYHLHQLQQITAINSQAADTIESILFGSRLLYAFNEFVACCVRQMNEHEAIVNQVLWRYYSNEELAQIAVAIKPTQVSFSKREPINNNSNYYNKHRFLNRQITGAAGETAIAV